MIVVRRDKGSNEPVYATATSTDDISAATVAICLHDDTNADTWLTSSWDTVPTLVDGVYIGEAVTNAAVDFSAKAAGNYLVKVKVGSQVRHCYVIRVVP